MNDVIRRKLSRAATVGADGGPGADHGWRIAFARAARAAAGLMVDVAAMSLARRSLAELLELPPDRALLAMLDGPAGGLGLLVMSPEVLASLVEMQTTGRVSSTPPLARRPTRTDAAMVAGVIDHALEELEGILAEEADLVWAGGFRYASFLEDPRPLSLLLEDQTYRVLTASLSLADGARQGSLILALPAEGRGRRPPPRPASAQPAKPAAGTGFSADLQMVVQGAGCALEAVIAHLTLPLREVMALQVGQVLVLPKASLDAITLEGIDGRPVAPARLGQARGMRAVRLTGEVRATAPVTETAVPGVAPAAPSADPQPVAPPVVEERLLAAS